MWEPQGIYSNFILKQPTIFQGDESIRGLFNFPGNRIAVIYGSGLQKEAQILLENTFKSRSLCFIKKSWSGEPIIEELGPTVKELESFNPDTIIAFGGGSVIDGAKLCRIYFEFPYIDWKHNRLQQMTFKTRFIAIPTTVGSGAEASSAAVYYSQVEKTKRMIVGHNLQPDAIVFDSRYVKNTQASIIYASIMDALAHMIEGYVSNRKNPLAEEMAVWGVSCIRQEMDKSDKEKLDYTRLQYAGYLGGIVQNHCLVGAAHAFAHQLTAYGYSHGNAVALLLRHTIHINGRDNKVGNSYQELAKKAGFSDKKDMTDFLEKIVYHINKENMNDLNGTLRDALLDKCFIDNVKADLGGKGNPVPITDEYINEFIGEFAL